MILKHSHVISTPCVSTPSNCALDLPHVRGAPTSHTNPIRHQSAPRIDTPHLDDLALAIVQCAATNSSAVVKFGSRSTGIPRNISGRAVRVQTGIKTWC